VRPTTQAVHSLADALTTSRLRADLRDSSPVESVAFSPDGRVLAVGSGDGTVRGWRLRDRRLLWTNKAATMPVNSLAFSAKGDVLAVGRSVGFTGPQSCSAELLDARTGAGRGTLGPPGSGTCSRHVAFLGARRLVAVGTDTGTIQFWNADDRTSLGPPAQVLGSADVPLQGLAVSRDGRRLAIVGLHRVEVADLRTGKSVANVTTAPSGIFNPFDVAFDPSGSRLLITGEYGTQIHFLDAQTIAELYAQDGSTQAAAWSPDGRLVAAGAGFLGLDVWSSSSRLVEVLHGGSSKAFLAVAFSSTGLLAGGSNDGSVRVWRPDPDVPDSTQRPPKGVDVNRAAAAPEAGLVVMGDAASVVALIDRNGRTLKTLEPHGDGPFAVGSRGVLAFTSHGRLIVWSLPRGDEGLTGALSSTAAPAAVAVSADGRSAATVGRDGLVSLFTAKGKLTALVSQLPFAVPSLSMSPDGRLLAVTGERGVRILDGRDLSPIRDEPGIAAAFSVSGRLLAIQRPGLAIDLLDTHSWRTRTTAHGEPVAVANLTFSPDDSLLAELGSDGVLRAWDTSDGALVGTRRVIEGSLQAQRVAVGPVVLTAAGTALVGNGADGTLDSYDVCAHCLDAKALLRQADTRLAQIRPVTAR
jgi:WD40 repeat protein